MLLCLGITPLRRRRFCLNSKKLEEVSSFTIQFKKTTIKYSKKNSKYFYNTQAYLMWGRSNEVQQSIKTQISVDFCVGSI